MIARTDWWVRLKAQDILNWCGRKFGTTRDGVARNATIIYFITTAYWCWMIGDFGTTIIMGIVGALIGFTLFLMFQLLKRKNGEDINWEAGMYWRRMHVFFTLPFWLFFDFLDGFTADDFVGYTSWTALAVVLWTLTLKEPPPKEVKQRQLAYVRS